MLAIQELICDKDCSRNGIFCRHLPEDTISHCSKNSAKNLHKILKYKCEVSILIYYS